jgi:hypothetical protein
MTEAYRSEGSGEVHELIDTKPSALAIYLSTHEACKITVKKKKVKDADGKKRKIRIIKINPPCDAMPDESINEIMSHKNSGVRVTEDQLLETVRWFRANRTNFSINTTLNFGKIDKGLNAIQKKLGIKPVKPTA